MDRDTLIKRIKETAYLEGDFVLRSGKRSKYYMDKYLFETCPDILKALGAEFAGHMSENVTLIAGAEPNLSGMINEEPMFVTFATKAITPGKEYSKGSQRGLKPLISFLHGRSIQIQILCLAKPSPCLLYGMNYLRPLSRMKVDKFTDVARSNIPGPLTSIWPLYGDTTQKGKSGKPN